MPRTSNASVEEPSWVFVGDLTPGRRDRSRDGKQTHKFLGGPLEFNEAKRQAEAWLAQLAGSAVRRIKRATVRGPWKLTWPTCDETVVKAQPAKPKAASRP
jgi:hypothetical protein